MNSKEHADSSTSRSHMNVNGSVAVDDMNISSRVAIRRNQLLLEKRTELARVMDRHDDLVCSLVIFLAWLNLTIRLFLCVEGS